ncbi:sulfate permease [Terrabacter sp. Root85]|uniref:SulP family inorganic anion transporter n=1 Tax=unclassified Terrabacter TaxID=2630222 RepID=UPI0006F227C3|nr:MULTISPECIES: SulP family inorganic anion transporter [unclassified Terrabacter]KRC89757.1 sulfate permease [Terrabacter sp. Root85]KRF47746.1 sulfate permease [Terrabacter sp. Soil811]
MARTLVPGLTRENVGSEALAGVTLLAIAVPLNIGYAQIAGLPPTAGLYALVLPAVLYALTVSSRQLVASPDAAAAALVASSIGGLAAAGSQSYASLALAQAIISGLLFVAFGLLKLGFIANFLSKPILIGFVGGLALDILVSQVAKMLGVKIDSGGEFVEKVGDLVTGLAKLSVVSVLLSAVAVAVLIGGRRLARTAPWALIVLVVATVVTVLAHLDEHGVSVLGEVPAGPPTLTWPELDLGQWFAVVPSAIALTLVTTAEGLLVSRSYSERRGYPIDANRELVAFGVGNVSAGLTGGFAVGSSTSRTAFMDSAGSRTQLPSIVAAVLTLLLLLFGTGLLADIPSPAIGAIVAVAVVPLLGIGELRSLWTKDRFEFGVAAACFLGALLLGPIPGILIAFVLALVNLTRRAANPAVEVLGTTGDPDQALPVLGDATESEPGVIVLRFSAPIFFANVGLLRDRVHAVVEEAESAGSGASRPSGEVSGAEPSPVVRHVVLDMEGVTDIDVTGAEGLEQLKSWLEGRGTRVHYSRLRPAVADRLHHFGLDEGTSAFGTNRAALEALRPR